MSAHDELIFTNKQRFEELFKIEKDLKEWSFEFPEKWIKEQRLQYLASEIRRTGDRVRKAEEKMSETVDIFRYFAPWTHDYPYCWNEEQRQEYKLPELIDSWFAFMFTPLGRLVRNRKPPVTLNEVKAMIYRKRVKNLKQAQKNYTGAIVRYGLERDARLLGCGQAATVDAETIQRLRQTPVIALLSDREQFNGGNKRIKMLCPFHKEKTPSFFIYPENSWYCFGCNEGGNNAIDFVMKYYKVDFLSAIDKLALF